MTKNLEWLDEPNQLSWQYDGYNCLIRRHPRGGHLLGYVEVCFGHPWFGREAGDDVFEDVDVYGGITYCCQESDLFGPLPTKSWWLGIDAAHGNDICPFGDKHKWDITMPDATYKNVDFMMAECEKLVRRCQDAVIKEEWRKKVAVSVDKIEAQINQDKDMLKNLMLQIIDHGYAAFDTYSRGSGGGVRPRYDNLKLIQATNMLIDMVKWGKFRTGNGDKK